MLGKPLIRQGTTGSGGFHRRWWNTLAFRLGVTVNVTVIVVLALSAWVAHRRDSAAQIQHVFTRLEEEARVLRAAWSQFRDPQRFQLFVDGFCRQMTPSASPGHHIALFDAGGHILVRAHERADPELEQRMRSTVLKNVRRFKVGEEPFAAHSLSFDDGAHLVVAVSVRPVEQQLRADGMSRAAATAILVLVLFGVTTICLLAWVRDPLREFVSVVSAVGEGRLDQRVKPRGAAELRFVADGVNEMVHAIARTERQRTSEMKRAREIQRALVGDRRHAGNGYELRTVFLPAETVGGDFFDIVRAKDGSTVVAVIDITGHGVPGALCTALLRSSLRHLSRQTADVGELARGLNRDLCDVAAAGVYATGVLLRLRSAPTLIEYAIAGHDPPLLIDRKGVVTSLKLGGLMLGVNPQTSYEIARIQVEPRCKLLLFTDGLHEAMSRDGEQFGRQRVAQLFVRTNSAPLEKQLASVVDSVRRFCGRHDFEDDVTVLGIEWAAEPKRSPLAVSPSAKRG